MKKDLPKFVSVKNLIRLFPRDPLLKKNVCNSTGSDERHKKMGSRDGFPFFIFHKFV